MKKVKRVKPEHMLKDRLNKSKWTDRMRSFFKHPTKSYLGRSVYLGFQNVLWVGFFCEKGDFWGTPLRVAFCYRYEPYGSRVYLGRAQELTDVTDDFVEKFNAYGPCAWGEHAWNKKLKTRHVCERCGAVNTGSSKMVRQVFWTITDKGAAEVKKISPKKVKKALKEAYEVSDKLSRHKGVRL